MDIGTADTASINLDVNITVTKRLGLELCRELYQPVSEHWRNVNAHVLLLEVTPLLVGLDHESLESVWVNHLDRWVVAIEPKFVYSDYRGTC